MNNQYFEKQISSFIDSQFPGFREEEGPNFVAFTRAYYEWLERTDRYTVIYNPTPGADFVVGASVINLNRTSEQALVVATGQNSVEILGDVTMTPGCTFSQINKIDQGVFGTVTFTANSRVVTGDGTSFLSHFVPGEYIYASEELYKITTITDDQALIIETPAAVSSSPIPYVRYVLSPPITVVSIYNTPNVVAASRRIPDDSDVDTALPQFVNYFKTKYMSSMPNEMLADKRFLTKHILDLYRAKGSERAYELLFRILFNQDVSIYLPSEHLLAPSEASWVVPKYIEVSDTDKLNEFINREIYSSSNDARATVEYVFRKNIAGRIVCGLMISNIQGIFHFGDYILCRDLPDVTKKNAPRITGSLTTVTMRNGGAGFSIGDLLDIRGTGIGGLGVVTSVFNESGKANFFLENGGSGYTMNAAIIVDSTGTGGSEASFHIGDLTNKEIIQVSTDLVGDFYNTTLDNVANTFVVTVANTTGTFTVGEFVTSSANVVPLDVTLASGTPTVGESISNGSVTATLRLFDVNFAEVTGNSAALVAGNSLFTGVNSGATFTINTVFTGKTVKCNAYVSVVSGANLTLKNCYSYSAANKVVLSVIVAASGNNYSNGDLVTFTGGGGTDALAIITTNANGAISSADIQEFGTNYTSAPTAVIATANGSGGVLTPTVGYLAGYPYPGATLTGSTSSATGEVSAVRRLMNWDFPAINIPDIENLDTPISAALTFETLEIGTIRYITGINPGKEYVLAPSVQVLEPEIALLAIDDGAGNIKGNNAIVTATAGDANGVVSSIKILDSGFGYQPQETVFLSNPLNNRAVTGDTVIDQHGIARGYWEDRKSFPSETMYIQDSYYWQRFSYDIQTARMIDTYRTYVKDLIHPAGMAMFGTFKKSVAIDEPSELMESSLTQS